MDQANCAYCTETFVLTHPAQKYCSVGCGAAVRKKQRYAKTCPVCSTDYLTKRVRQVYCSAPCRSKALRRPNATCPVCEKAFHPNTGTQKYCSTICANTGRRRFDLEGGVCHTCGLTHPPEFFKWTGGSHNGRSYDCYNCRMAAWRQKTYGMSPEDFELCLQLQGFQCPGCERPFTSELGPHVDHDKATGEVRGLLCLMCNCTLGLYYDREDLLARAELFLVSHHEKNGVIVDSASASPRLSVTPSPLPD